MFKTIALLTIAIIILLSAGSIALARHNVQSLPPCKAGMVGDTLYTTTDAPQTIAAPLTGTRYTQNVYNDIESGFVGTLTADSTSFCTQ